MSKEVSNTQIMQAITELSGDLNTVSAKVDKLEVQLTETEKKVSENGEKIDKVDAKFSIIRDEILSTKADVKMLQDAN